MPNRAALIAVDWGTTSARAYRLDAKGEVLDSRAAPLGISQVVGGHYAEALVRLLGDWDRDVAPRIACGMIGSRQGWVEAPYLECPAPLSALADGLVRTPGDRLLVVPGLRTRDGHGMPDVMRGEETQIIGAVGRSHTPVLLALPGTHSKWVCVENGRIVDFVTYMTGEMWSVLLQHSILGRLAVQGQPGTTVTGAFRRGMERGFGKGTFMHDIFGARTHVLLGELAGDEVGEWLSGFVIAREVRSARLWAQRRGYDAARVRLVGDDALVARYVTALTQAEVKVERADSRAAAFGLWQIAVQAGLVHLDTPHS